MTGFVHVDMRVGLVAGDEISIGDHFPVKIGVHVEGDPNWRSRRQTAQSCQQGAFAVFEALGDHRAVQIEQDGIATGLDCGANRIGDIPIGIVVYPPARPGVGSDRSRDLSAGSFG